MHREFQDLGKNKSWLQCTHRYLLCRNRHHEAGGCHRLLLYSDRMVTGGKDKRMKYLVAKNEFGMYADNKGIARVDSLTVAEVFEKRHDNVVRDIRNLDCSEEFRLLNFEESTYVNAQGHRQACFNMTCDGFVFLVMGYRGKKAASFKEAYIKRFNEMEEFIKYLLEARTEFPLLTDNIQLLHEKPMHYHFSPEPASVLILLLSRLKLLTIFSVLISVFWYQLRTFRNAKDTSNGTT